ncbi:MULTISPECIES: TolC family protein [Bacteroides]|nr:MULTISPECIES: TolC family protein [Bacteroides]EEO51957.1 outer membrane efflux protein [Bacteroides sp. D1]EEZ01924.1 outer membrane efflux protein [Bacteroides sp. 2_1_22]EFG12720.1 outer membrane efflux protein [Bacteroides xylanisolvens SD CC 1b]
MKTQLITLSLLLLGLTAGAQQPYYLSREAYRDKVEAYSQILKQQKLKTMASTEARKIAHTGFLPKIDVNADGTLNMSDLNAWNEPIGEYRNHTYQGVFIVSQPLYTGGALNAQHKIAKADEKLNQLNEELTIDQIHYQSDAVYWNASASQAMLQAADKYQSIVKQQYDIIQDRFNDGMISRTDLLMISTRLKEAELQYIKARQNYTLALQKLNILMGEEPNNPVDSLYTIDTASAPVQILSLENVLQRRADYESTEVNIMKSQAQRKAALSQFNPQLNMYFSGGWATATPNLGYDVSFNPIVGINLNIPIFRWGARFKTNRQQKAYISIQKLQQSYVTDNINEELSAALTKLTETEYQVKTAKETMSLANENLDLVSFSYNEGKANMVDVLSAQLSWTQAHTNLINAYLSEKMAVAEYRKVISE